MSTSARNTADSCASVFSFAPCCDKRTEKPNAIASRKASPKKKIVELGVQAPMARVMARNTSSRKLTAVVTKATATHNGVYSARSVRRRTRIKTVASNTVESTIASTRVDNDSGASRKL